MRHETTPSSFAREATVALQQAGFVPPGDNEAHVVQFDSAPWWPLFQHAVELLPEHEVARAHRFHHARDRNTYALAHAFWRVALGLTLNCAPDSVPLGRGTHGQPLLPDTPFATSLSHSGSQVAFAIANSQTVGVDIEQSPPRAKLRELTAMLCTRAEAQALEALPDATRTQAMLSLWTRKEALLKAFGVGLRVAPSTIDAPLDCTIEPPPAAADSPACRVYPLEFPPTLTGAIAAPVSITHVQLHTLLSTHGAHLTA
jgi:4'-phosphopantetheinyl transferase